MGYMMKEWQIRRIGDDDYNFLFFFFARMGNAEEAPGEEDGGCAVPN